MSEPKTLVSLFDYSGTWCAPYYEAGFNVVQLDLKHSEAADVKKFCVEYLVDELGLDEVDGLLMAPPCTDFTISGNQYWAAKDTDGRTAASLHLVRQGLRCVEYFKPDFWSLENPIGRLPKLLPELGKAFVWHPWEFAGHAEPFLSSRDRIRLAELEAGAEVSRSDIDIIKRSGRYTKRTCLWGRFNRPQRDPRFAIRCCKQGSWLQMLGGDRDSTKEARSDTPDGFARAFFAANSWTPAQRKAWNAERAAEWCLYMLDGDKSGDPLKVFDDQEHPETTPRETQEAFARLYQAKPSTKRSRGLGMEPVRDLPEHALEAFEISGEGKQKARAGVAA